MLRVSGGDRDPRTSDSPKFRVGHHLVIEYGAWGLKNQLVWSFGAYFGIIYKDYVIDYKGRLSVAMLQDLCPSKHKLGFC